jgi:CheY-like chemotaxis protein
VSHPCERVLVVDDDRDLAEILAEALRAEGARVEVALGADAALGVIADGFAPSIVLTDLTMPGRSGDELIEDLRRLPVTRDTPVVAMSASRMQLTRLDGRAEACLAKPFTIETLYAVLASLC